MTRAMGISVHTGWCACVVVGGSPAQPRIVANEVVEILGDAVRFCFHMPARTKRSAAEEWIAHARAKATANARHAMAPLVAKDVTVRAIVAKEIDAGTLDEILASHPRIHLAEGCFYRDVLRDACPVPVHFVAPATLDPASVGKLAPSPWGRNQKLAALAAWRFVTN